MSECYLCKKDKNQLGLDELQNSIYDEDMKVCPSCIERKGLEKCRDCDGYGDVDDMQSVADDNGEITEFICENCAFDAEDIDNMIMEDDDYEEEEAMF